MWVPLKRHYRQREIQTHNSAEQCNTIKYPVISLRTCSVLCPENSHNVELAMAEESPHYIIAFHTFFGRSVTLLSFSTLFIVFLWLLNHSACLLHSLLYYSALPLSPRTLTNTKGKEILTPLSYFNGAWLSQLWVWVSSLSVQFSLQHLNTL